MVITVVCVVVGAEMDRCCLNMKMAFAECDSVSLCSQGADSRTKFSYSLLLQKGMRDAM